MKALFRADASLTIGTGHVMRCLTLAKALLAHGAAITFVCRDHPGNLIDFIKGSGFPVHVLPLTDRSDVDGPHHAAWLGSHWTDDAEAMASHLRQSGSDWVMVDHYGLDARFEQAMVAAGASVAVIDDLGDRPHHCKLLLDQTFGRETPAYEGRVPQGTLLLLGSRFALLRPEFAAAARDSLQRRRERPALNRILVTLGGVDIDNVTRSILDVLDAFPLPQDGAIDVVMGVTAPWLGEIEQRATTMSHATTVRRGVRDMAALMVEADLAIGAAGSTAWERCCLGLPCLMVVTADNQQVIARNLDEAGAAISLGGHHDEDFVLRLQDGLSDLLESPDRLLTMTEAAARVTDGRGAARVAQAMMELSAA
jgi:UDP-2,4-diacetamido-2,4,6-trideoxy-beta-L-altropyranose hydrolase